VAEPFDRASPVAWHKQSACHACEGRLPRLRIRSDVICRLFHQLEPENDEQPEEREAVMVRWALSPLRQSWMHRALLPIDCEHESAATQLRKQPAPDRIERLTSGATSTIKTLRPFRRILRRARTGATVDRSTANPKKIYNSAAASRPFWSCGS
jgi:hypothetical protein